MMSLHENFESYGGFWLPDETEKVITGRLVFDPAERIELNLSESIDDDSKTFDLLPSSHIPIILGKLVNGNPVTLINGLRSNRTIGMGPGGPLLIYIHAIFLGVHFHDLEQLKIVSFRTSFNHMEGWSGHNSMASENRMAEGEERRLGIDIKYSFPTELAFDVPPANTTIKIAQQLNSHRDFFDLTLSPVTFFEVIPNNPIGHHASNDLKWHLQNLTTLLTGYPVASRFMELKVDVPDTFYKTPTTTVEWLFEQTSKVKETPKYEFQMLVPFKEVAATFGDVLSKWFECVKRSKVALDVCFGTLYQPSEVMNLRFLTAMQSIESFHRSLGTGLYMDQEKYKAAIAPLLTIIPNDIEGSHKQSLKNRLHYGNEYSLQKRLNTILASLPANLCEAIAIDRNQFVLHLVKTRNQFTHYNQVPEEPLLKGVYIHRATERVRVLIAALILLEIGVDKNSLYDILHRSENYKEAMYSDMPYKRKEPAAATGDPEEAE